MGTVKPDSEKVAILSGRYEIIHPGHIKTIRQLARKYKTLYVYIVDNPNTPIPITWNKELIDFCTMDLMNVITVLDPCHFGRATIHDIERLPKFDDFLVGNKYVKENLVALGVNVVEFEERTEYSSTEFKVRMLREAAEAWRRDVGK